MKRHPALEQLSRDHHHALVVAQQLKRADPTNAEQARMQFLDYWRVDGQAHFREEEEILLPALARFTDPYQPMVARVLIDHVRIRRLEWDVRQGADLNALHILGGELEGHVRREERELFPFIERTIPEPELAVLAELLSER